MAWQSLSVFVESSWILSRLSRWNSYLRCIHNTRESYGCIRWYYKFMYYFPVPLLWCLLSWKQFSGNRMSTHSRYEAGEKSVCSFSFFGTFSWRIAVSPPSKCLYTCHITGITFTGLSKNLSFLRNCVGRPLVEQAERWDGWLYCLFCFTATLFPFSLVWLRRAFQVLREGKEEYIYVRPDFDCSPVRVEACVGLVVAIADFLSRYIGTCPSS